MNIKEIFDVCEKVGCLTYATIDEDGYPETRIAHFIGYDDEGLYVSTMNVKPFYKQLKETGKLSVCGMAANSAVEHINEANIAFAPGYFIRLSGDVKEVTIDEIKAKNNPTFTYFIEDNKRYPSMTTFCLYSFKGEIFDYDFEKQFRDHKLERQRFSFNGFKTKPAGLTISENCIGCGTCENICSFSAIKKDGDKYKIDSTRCDECGNCLINCPVQAIIGKGK